MIVMLGIALLLVCAIVRGIVLSVLWSWFMVPLSVAPIETAHAIGISILVGLFTASHSSQTNEERMAELLVMGFMYPVLALLMGYLANSAM